MILNDEFMTVNDEYNDYSEKIRYYKIFKNLWTHHNFCNNPSKLDKSFSEFS